MFCRKLIDDLRPELSKAKEVWIAVALLKDSALDHLLSVIPKDAKQKYLVGIDLPTTPTVLKILQIRLSKTFRAAIFKTSKTFHPKVYLINDGRELCAFVGSANLTNGGLSDNIEMSLVTRDQGVCQSLLEWFNNLYSTSFPLDDQNIKEYETHFRSVAELEKQSRSIRAAIKLKKADKVENPLDDIDFSARYFSYANHSAFRSNIVRVRTPEANTERKETYDRFYELHREIFPKFLNSNLSNLHHHKTKEYIVSHYFHADGFTSNELSAMWLSYGKPEGVISKYQDLFGKPRKGERNPDREAQSFINHARLQIIIHYDSIGIWLFFGKKNGGSKFDRDHFKNKMKDSVYRDDIFERFNGLPSQYFISLDDNSWLKAADFRDSASFFDYCKGDYAMNHFIIGRNYNIEDDEMSSLKLPTTVLTEFQRLYPLYDIMRDKTFG